MTMLVLCMMSPFFVVFFLLQTEMCVFEVWDIPWQNTTTLVKQKCHPKGQLPKTGKTFKSKQFEGVLLKQMQSQSIHWFQWSSSCELNKQKCKKYTELVLTGADIT